MTNIEAIIIIPERTRQPLLHEVVRGAERLWPHQLVDSCPDWRVRPLEPWQNSAKPVRRVPAIRKVRGGFAG